MSDSDSEEDGPKSVKCPVKLARWLSLRFGLLGLREHIKDECEKDGSLKKAKRAVKGLDIEELELLRRFILRVKESDPEDLEKEFKETQVLKILEEVDKKSKEKHLIKAVSDKAALHRFLGLCVVLVKAQHGWYSEQGWEKKKDTSVVEIDPAELEIFRTGVAFRRILKKLLCAVGDEAKRLAEDPILPDVKEFETRQGKLPGAAVLPLFGQWDKWLVPAFAYFDSEPTAEQILMAVSDGQNSDKALLETCAKLMGSKKVRELEEKIVSYAEAIEGKGVGYYWSDVALKVLDDATAAKKEKAEAEKAKADKEKRDALAKAKRDAEKAAHHAPGGAEDGGAGNTDVHMEMKKSLLKKSLKKGLLAAKAKVLFHLGIRRDAAASPPVSPRGLKGLKTFRPPPEPATAHPAGAAAHADAKQHADDEPKGFLGSALKVCLALAQPWIVFFKFVWWLTGIGLDEDDKELQSAFLGQVFGIYALFTASLLLIFTQQKCGAEQKMEIFNPYLGRNQTWIPDDSTEICTFSEILHRTSPYSRLVLASNFLTFAGFLFMNVVMWLREKFIVETFDHAKFLPKNNLAGREARDDDQTTNKKLEVFTQRMFPCLAPFAYFLSCCCFTFCCKSNVKGSEKARSVMERYRHFRNIPIERAPKLKIEDTATRLERAGANKAGADVQKANEVERRLVYNERDPGAMKLVSCIRDTAGCWIECWMGDEVEVHKEKLGSAYEKRKPNRFVAGFRPGKAQNSAATFLIDDPVSVMFAAPTGRAFLVGYANGYTELWSTKAAAGEKEVIVLEYRTLLDEFKPGVDNNPAPAVGVPPPFVLIEDDGVAPPKIATVGKSSIKVWTAPKDAGKKIDASATGEVHYATLPERALELVKKYKKPAASSAELPAEAGAEEDGGAAPTVDPFAAREVEEHGPPDGRKRAATLRVTTYALGLLRTEEDEDDCKGFLAVGLEGGRVEIFKVSRDGGYAPVIEPPLQLPNYDRGVTAIALAEDCMLLAAAQPEFRGANTVVYRRNTWSCNWPFDTPLCTFKWGGHPTCMAFDPGCEFLATGCDDRIARVWKLPEEDDDADKEQPKVNKSFSPEIELEHAGQVTCVAFSQDGFRLATGDSGTWRQNIAIRVWDAYGTSEDDPYTPDWATAGLFLALEGHKKEVTSVSFSEDEKRLVSVSRDRTVRFWDIDYTTEQGNCGPDSCCFALCNEPAAEDEEGTTGGAAAIRKAGAGDNKTLLEPPIKVVVDTKLRKTPEDALLLDTNHAHDDTFHALRLGVLENFNKQRKHDVAAAKRKKREEEEAERRAAAEEDGEVEKEDDEEEVVKEKKTKKEKKAENSDEDSDADGEEENEEEEDEEEDDDDDFDYDLEDEEGHRLLYDKDLDDVVCVECNEEIGSRDWCYACPMCASHNLCLSCGDALRRSLKFLPKNEERQAEKELIWRPLRIPGFLRPKDREGELSEYPEFYALLIHYNYWAYSVSVIMMTALFANAALSCGSIFSPRYYLGTASILAIINSTLSTALQIKDWMGLSKECLDEVKTCSLFLTEPVESNIIDKDLRWRDRAGGFNAKAFLHQRKLLNARVSTNDKKKSDDDDEDYLLTEAKKHLLQAAERGDAAALRKILGIAPPPRADGKPHQAEKVEPVDDDRVKDICKAVDDNGENALILAASSGKVEALRVLLEEHKLGCFIADINRQDEGGETALLSACRVDSKLPKPPPAPDAGQSGAGQSAAGQPRSSTVGDGKTGAVEEEDDGVDGRACVELLLKHGANPLLKRNDGDYPINVAAINDNCMVIEALLEHFRTNYRDNTNKEKDAAKLALELPGEGGMTSLYYAARFECVRTVRYLLGQGANCHHNGITYNATQLEDAGKFAAEYNSDGSAQLITYHMKCLKDRNLPSLGKLTAAEAMVRKKEDDPEQVWGETLELEAKKDADDEHAAGGESDSDFDEEDAVEKMRDKKVTDYVDPRDVEAVLRQFKSSKPPKRRDVIASLKKNEGDVAATIIEFRNRQLLLDAATHFR